MTQVIEVPQKEKITKITKIERSKHELLGKENKRDRYIPMSMIFSMVLNKLPTF